MPCRPVSATASSTGRDLADPGLTDQAYNAQTTSSLTPTLTSPDPTASASCPRCQCRRRLLAHRAIQAITDRGIEVLIRPDGNVREGKRPGREIGFYQPTAESADGRAADQTLVSSPHVGAICMRALIASSSSSMW